MLLPYNILTDTYERPRCFLCDTNKEKLCLLETSNLSGAFKFNSYSTLTFEVGRIYNDLITGDIRINPYYNKIEALRLVLLEGFGYFELQDPEIESDGIKEIKSLTANSFEYTLSQKYLENLYVNTGQVDSVEVMYAEENGLKSIAPVTLYNPNNPKLSLLHIVLEKAYGWHIGHVDSSLQTMSRKFEVDRESIYDFIMNEICEQFNCYAIFDTFENTINLYAEAQTNKFYGDGTTSVFVVSPVFPEIGTVSIDGYKTTDYMYNNVTGELILGSAPASGRIIEVTDGSLASWETDVFVTFDNLAQQMNVSYTSDDIKTVLTVKGADELDIREVNNGLPYIVDLSYFYTVDWMGQDLYDAYTEYLAKCAQRQSDYKTNSQEIIELSNKISYETNRLSLQYSEVSVFSDTVGTYYVRGGDADSGYYYTEVSLPQDYIAGTTYYSIHTTDLTEEKVADLYEALKTYYSTGETTKFTDEEIKLSDSFSFMEENTIDGLVLTLSSESIVDADKDNAVLAFLDEMWNQLGLTPLKTLYLAPYKEVQTANVSAGWAKKDNDNYGLYYPVVLMLDSLNTAIATRETAISELTKLMTNCSEQNAAISNELLIDNNFTEEQMIRLSAFLREDEYTDDNFVATGNESTAELFQLKQELLECGRIELSKLSSPCFKFTMSLANIYALPEFAPIVNQFQLGNLIKVALRPDHIKHTRLMQVDLNFEDFSDFSCEFGDLSTIRSQSDLHADLLSQAVSAGKTVASNASYWNKGTDTATSIDVRLQQGLLNAATEIKSIDGTQHSFMDKYGLHLQEINPDTGEVSPEQGWIVNNQFLYSDDAFKTTKSVFGKYTVDDETRWGLLAEAVIAGYVEGSKIVGGTIQIGERDNGGYNFEVDDEGHITMIGGKGINSNGDTVDLDMYNTSVELTSDATVFNNDSHDITLTCKVLSYGVDVTDKYDASAFYWYRSTDNSTLDDEWSAEKNTVAHGNTFIVTINDVSDVAFFGCRVAIDPSNIKYSNDVAIASDNSNTSVFSKKPSGYKKGDLWIVNNDYQPAGYSVNTIMVCIEGNSQYADEDWVESVYYSKTFEDLHEWQDDMQEHVQILDDGLHLIGPSSEGVSFESVLQSKKLTFRSNQGGTATDVIWLGVDNTTAKNVTALNYIDVKSESNDTLPYIKLGNFTFQVEDNGSLSII